jgi:hypothetical protein
MINNILNVDGVKELSKDELRKTNGGMQCTYQGGEVLIRVDEAGQFRSAMCEMSCQKTFLGIGWTKPKDMMIPCGERQAISYLGITASPAF